MILAATSRSDARLIAYAVMSNHIHLILQQGSRPLSHYMQPLLRRVALLVGRSSGWEGHVFSKRYDDFLCATPDYARNAIAYVHLNGFRAGLTSSALDYPWCSETQFSAGQGADPLSTVGVEDALRLFAESGSSTLVECSANYRAFVRWRLDADEFASDCARAPVTRPAPTPPDVSGGDDYWARVYAPFVTFEAERRSRAAPRLDLRDLAQIVIRDTEPRMPLDVLRSGSSSRRVVAVRRRLVERASAAGHTGIAISRFLNISPSSVSTIRARLVSG